MENEAKKYLNDGNSLKLKLMEFGPIKMTTGMGLNRSLRFLVPSVLILLMIACSELGISGITIPTFSEMNTISAGGYYSLGRSVFVSPHLESIWNKCTSVKDDDTYVGHVAKTSYTQKFNETDPMDPIEALQFDVEKVQCSEKNDVYLHFDGLSSVHFPGNFSRHINYNILDWGDLVYIEEHGFNGFLNNLFYNVYIRESTAIYEYDNLCSYTQCPSSRETSLEEVHTVFLVYSHTNLTYAIIDDSSNKNGSGERWLIDADAKINGDNENERRTVLEGGGSYFSEKDDDFVVVECEEGCFQAIVEWVIRVQPFTGYSLKLEIDLFFRIWYGGLYYDRKIFYGYQSELSSVKCNTFTGFSNWKIASDERGFSSGTCEDAVNIDNFPDGGQKNVTIVSYWAFYFAVLGIASAILYYIFSKFLGDDYNLFSYSGLSKLCYSESRPNSSWIENTSLEVSLLDGNIRVMENGRSSYKSDTSFKVFPEPI